VKKVRPRVKIAATKNHSFFGKPNTHQQRVNSIHTRLTRLQRLTCNGDYLKLNWPGILAHMPLPSAKSKPQEQKDPKKQKSLLGWLSKPADTKVANSSSAVRNAPVTSSSPSGRESIFETPSTKKRTTFGADAQTVRSATFSKSSDGGTSFNETPPSSDPIDVDMSSDEDVPGRGVKSVCGTCTYAFTWIGDNELCHRLAQNGKLLSMIRMKGKLTTILLPPKGKDHPHIGPLKNLVRRTLIYITWYLVD
jgi:hypothetical protein